jgi:hypothetical protein
MLVERTPSAEIEAAMVGAIRLYSPPCGRGRLALTFRALAATIRIAA